MKINPSNINKYPLKSLMFGSFYILMIPALLVLDRRKLFIFLVIFQFITLIYSFTDPVTSLLLHMIILITLLLSMLRRSL